jgi:hypothetical protein
MSCLVPVSAEPPTIVCNRESSSGCFEKTVEGGKGERYGYHWPINHFIFSALDDVMGNAGVTLANTSGLTRLEFPAFSCGRRTPDEDWYEHWRSLTV